MENMRFQNAKGPPRWALSLTQSLWGKFTPFAIARKLSDSRVKKVLASYVRKHQPGESEEENKAMEEYLY